MKRFLLLSTLALLSTTCAGGLSAPSAFLCSTAGSLQTVCATPGEKPRSVAKLCKKSVIIPLLCGPNASATPAVCPPVVPAGCTSGVLAGLNGRFMTSSEKEQLAECASYLAQALQCAAAKP